MSCVQPAYVENTAVDAIIFRIVKLGRSAVIGVERVPMYTFCGTLAELEESRRGPKPRTRQRTKKMRKE